MNETPKDWVGGPYPCVQSPLVPPRACMRGDEVSQMVDGPSIICEDLKLAPYHRALKMAQLAGSCSSKPAEKIAPRGRFTSVRPTRQRQSICLR